ncbi:uncharacterized protein LOC102801395, partial [Saccoglossus kowalevskii]|uniref:Uncharacterized protein LOC102801395 n=1 Tax=Saccoglossus kowalevskii TaxID=10224 RepID=A0ABM0MXI4_SACKO
MNHQEPLAVYSPVTIATSVGLLLSLLISITLCGWCISKVKHSYRKYKIGQKAHSSGAHIHVSKSEESIPLKKKHHKHHLSQPPASQVQKPAQHSHPHTPQIHKAHQPEKPKIVVEHEHKTPQTYLHVYPQQREKFTPVLGRRTIDFERPVRKATSLEHIPPQREGMDDSSSDMSTTSPMISLASLKDTLGL